ncbi:hypothetical protein E4U49_004370 [Claviceps purpurea]|nr:hypothetical protein E4U49_004370 [Claviceps purpurea]
MTENFYEGARIPNLTQINQDIWFSRMKMKLRGKGIAYALDQTIYQYAWMENTKGTSAKEQISESKTSNKKLESKTSNEKAESETSDGVKEITAGMARLGGSWDYQLRKEFEIADGKASGIILGSLSPGEQGLVLDLCPVSSEGALRFVLEGYNLGRVRICGSHYKTGIDSLTA